MSIATPSQDLLDRVKAHNSHPSRVEDGEEGTYLLPMAVAQGSPVHPAYPSGHAVNVGAYITTLKVKSVAGVEVPLQHFMPGSYGSARKSTRVCAVVTWDSFWT